MPPTGSPATGFSVVTIDTVANTLNVQESFSGLVGGSASAAHIHCCTRRSGQTLALAVPFTNFPATASGTYNNTFRPHERGNISRRHSSPRPGGTAAAPRPLSLTGLAANQAYANIHNSTFPNGEIRGFLAAAIPEPGSWMLMIAGLGLVGATLRRRRAAPA